MPAKKIEKTPVELESTPATETCLTCMADPCQCDVKEYDPAAPAATKAERGADGLIRIEIPVGSKSINATVDPSKSNRKLRRMLADAEDKNIGDKEAIFYSLLSKMIVTWDLVDSLGRPVLLIDRVPEGTPEYEDGRECLEDVDDNLILAIWNGVQEALSSPNANTSPG